MRRLLDFSILFLIFASVAAAQDLSDEELLRRLETQSELLGKTRGLGIVTRSEDADTSGAAAQTDDGLTSLADIKSGDVVRFDASIAVNVRIEFEFDSAALSASQKPALDQMCRVIKQAEDIERFRIIGHTDSSGSDVYNQRLSKLRAEEVGRHLIGECGIPASRLDMVGYGEQYPENEADTRAPENRRVEFQALS